MWDLLFLIPPFVACIIMLGIFGYLGIHVLKREIIFIDIALAQIAAVGSTFAFLYLGTHEHSSLSYLSGFAFTVLASIFFSQVNKKIVQIPHEAIIGVSYAIAAAAALFMLAVSAGGDVHLEHMLTGSIWWTQWPDIIFCAILFGGVGLFHYIFRDRFIKLSENFGKTIDKNKHAIWWDFLFYVSMGLVITYSVKIAGVLVIFSLLIIPATFSAIFAESWKGRLIIAWGVGFFSIIGGLIFSYLFDFSCGPSVIMLLGLLLIIASIFWKCKKIRTVP